MTTGVFKHDEDRAYEGYTLFADTYQFPSDTRDGKGKVYLIDMDGNVVHRWETEGPLQSHCKLMPDGNLIYPTRDRSNISGRVTGAAAGIRELNPDSEVVWSYRCRIDHDFQVVGEHELDHSHPEIPDGRMLLHTLSDYMSPHIGDELMRHSYIVEIDRDKNVYWEWYGDEHYDDLEEQLTDEEWEFVEGRIQGGYDFDWAHNNTLQVIPPNETYEKEKEQGKDPVFEPGNIVFSYRSVDVIGVIDYPSGEIVWAWGPDELDGQHLPHVLENGNILIYDNGTERGWSRVIEVDPLTEEIVWEWRDDPKERHYAPYISGARRLPNGNTLICEGTKSHLFEVTPDGDIVWDFMNPHGETGASDEIYRCQRYSPEYVEPLLDRI